MSNPTPFNIARQVGENFAPMVRQQNDKRVLDDIFSQVGEGNETDLMKQILTRVSAENRNAAMGILEHRQKFAQRNKLLAALSSRNNQGEPAQPTQSGDAANQQTIPSGLGAEGNQATMAVPIQDQIKTQNIQQKITPSDQTIESEYLNLSPSERIQLSQIDPELSKQVENQIEQREKRGIEERKYAAEETKPLKEEMRTLEREMPNTLNALHLAEQAITGAGKWSGVGETLANITGVENFRTRKGAELQSAIKQYFLGDLSSIKGGRPNMLIERQLLDAYMKMGRDPISNRKILLGLQMKEEVSKAKLDAYHELEDRYLSQGKRLPANAEYIVKKKLESLAEKIQSRTLNAMNRLDKVQTRTYDRAQSQLRKDETLMIDQEGNAFAVPEKEVDLYLKKDWIKI